MIETKTKEHKDDWAAFSDVPPQEYTSAVRINDSSLLFEASLDTLHPEHTKVRIELPLWVWDQVDWDDTNHFGLSSFGELILGPTADDEEDSKARNETNKHRLRIVGRKMSALDDEEAEACSEELAMLMDEATESIDCLFMDEDELVDDQELWDTMEEASELLEALRNWLYRSREIEVYV